MTAKTYPDPFGAFGELATNSGPVALFRLKKLIDVGVGRVERLPFSIKILLENLLRHAGNGIVDEADVRNLAAWGGRIRGGGSGGPGSPSPQPSPFKGEGAEGRPAGVSRELAQRRTAAASDAAGEIPFTPARVVLQDFTGVPAIVDLAAMRSAMVRLGGDPGKINPLVPVDLVIDHSVQVDRFGSRDALALNEDIEFARNRERYEFLRWGQQAFANFRVVPPATGIVHQVNLEYLAKVVMRVSGEGLGARRDSRTSEGSDSERARAPLAIPDTLVGTDSHTTMINGLGVLGWGVGGIEAEACMLGQPIYMLTPEVVGFKLNGHLAEGATATDLVLTVTEMLRKKGVVDKFVEFYGDGLSDLGLPDRATIANMAPEYGATMGFFPVDNETLAYLRRTGRTAEEVDLVERYCKEQGLFRTDGLAEPVFSDTMFLELGTVEPSLAGPKRPQDRVRLGDMKTSFRKALTTVYAKPTPNLVEAVGRWEQEGGHLSATTAGGGRAAPSAPAGADTLTPALSLQGRGSVAEGGCATAELDAAVIEIDGRRAAMRHGSVVIAAITSCTNTSNPSVMLGAGILARKAVERGLKVPPYVKTSMAPGSKVVSDYLRKAGVDESLERLGFYTVGYGCTTCIGNSGPLPEPVAEAIVEHDLIAASVLSGNRNFEGRVHPLTKANYLASPPLVVAYALAGRADIDLTSEPLGTDAAGKNVYLRDIWPTKAEVAEAIEQCVSPEMFKRQYANVFTGNEKWNRIKVPEGGAYQWNPESTYIQEPPFFVDLAPEPGPIRPIEHARVLVMVGDSVTTDHISPAGSIPKDGPAGRYLIERGVEPKDFNSFGSRRGNDRVMTRGTFANIRLRNLLAPGTEGGWTRYLPSGEQMSIFDAAMKYRQSKTPLVVIGGAEYGTGSSRDWAAKGPLLLGIRAAIAVGYERIHRSNLVFMGILPLQFKPGQTRESLGLTGEEVFTIEGLSDDLKPGQDVTVVAKSPDGGRRDVRFQATVRIDTPVEIEYYRNGGILQTVLRKMLK